MAFRDISRRYGAPCHAIGPILRSATSFRMEKARQSLSTPGLEVGG